MSIDEPEPFCVPDLIEPVIGFRQWRLTDDGLYSLTSEELWRSPRLDALCRVGGHPHEVSPSARCSCGVYAWYEPCPRAASAATRNIVAGAVVMWGAGSNSTSTVCGHSPAGSQPSLCLCPIGESATVCAGPPRVSVCRRCAIEICGWRVGCTEFRFRPDCGHLAPGPAAWPSWIGVDQQAIDSAITGPERDRWSVPPGGGLHLAADGQQAATLGEDEYASTAPEANSDAEPVAQLEQALIRTSSCRRGSTDGGGPV